jgi:hypothetical protein
MNPLVTTNTPWYEILFLLLAAHAICDYALQGDFMSKAKNHKLMPDIWWMVLPSHSLIQAAGVFVILGSFKFTMIELFSHMIIDYLKCDNRFSYAADQFLHVCFRVAYLVGFLWLN